MANQNRQQRDATAPVGESKIIASFICHQIAAYTTGMTNSHGKYLGASAGIGSARHVCQQFRKDGQRP